jgi:glycosyltransferase involved in cell wall biosynthesis
MNTIPGWITDPSNPAGDDHWPARVRRVALLGSYLPRQCGIATFTADLSEALAAEFPDLACVALAMNDVEGGYVYPTRVRFEIAQEELASYSRAADFLELNNVDLLCVQHEYGIYGGEAGRHLLALLRKLRIPVVTTLHTILAQPEPAYRDVLQELAAVSDRLVTMSTKGVDLLQHVYHIPPDQIERIPHGIPDVPFVDPSFYKDQFGVEGKCVVLTFGLLSPNKGIEYIIRALPQVCERHPNLAYILLGATHPHVRRHAGEQYRESLLRLADELGVAEHVIFHNRFVALEELVEYIGAADLYVTPYLNPAQITSGTLAYAVGAGKAVISTPYWYAEELLADGRGRLVGFGDADGLAREMIALLDNETERHAMRKRAYLYGRAMIWPAVARDYMTVFARAHEERARRPRGGYAARVARRPTSNLPAINLEHVLRLTDGTGILQHAVGKIPNYSEGYTTDDNARALTLMVMLQEIDPLERPELVTVARRLSEKYLAFLWHAFDTASGRFRNCLQYDRRWSPEASSEDCHGRALWALGAVAGRSTDSRMRTVAGRLFHLALPAVRESTSPRSWAYTLIAIHEYLRHFYGDSTARVTREQLAPRLLDVYQRTAGPDWPWFENELAYANARLPQALLLSGRWMSRGDMTEAALRALDWLAHVQCAEEGHFVPIGNRGFYRRGGPRARFDQQPIEAHAMMSAALEAYEITKDQRWLTEAQRAFEWFLGRNDVGLPLYDPTTGGCHDGLHPQRVNQNQGAESTLALLLALVEMRLAADRRRHDANRLLPATELTHARIEP